MKKVKNKENLIAFVAFSIALLLMLTFISIIFICVKKQKSSQSSSPNLITYDSSALFDTVSNEYNFQGSSVLAPCVHFNFPNAPWMMGGWTDGILLSFSFDFYFLPTDTTRSMFLTNTSCSIVQQDPLNSVFYRDLQYYQNQTSPYSWIQQSRLTDTTRFDLTSKLQYRIAIALNSDTFYAAQIFLQYNSDWWDFENPFISSFLIERGPYFGRQDSNGFNWFDSFALSVGGYATRVSYFMGKNTDPFLQVLVLYKTPIGTESRTIYTQDGLNLLLGDTSGYYFQDGYQQGFLLGQNDGLAQGLQQGESIGYDKGYAAGTIHGAATANDYTFASLFTGMFDSMISTFSALFDFKFFGYDLREFMLSILGICAVMVLVRFFLK